MEIEKTLTVSAAPEKVWALLLDPQVMAGAVPGMKSIDVISPTEYVAVMHQKISFISAKFKLRTRIVEQRAPEYLCAEGTGEDASVASSLKQRSEVFLTPTADGGTELRIKVNVDLLGRLGTFGLSVMKTKADRLWEEFGSNLAARLEGRVESNTGVAVPAAPAPSTHQVAAPAPSRAPTSASGESPKPIPTAPAPSVSASPAAGAMPVWKESRAESSVEADPGWWARLLSAGRSKPVARLSDRMIRVEVRQLDKTINVEWPVENAEQCRDWLREIMK